MSKPVWRVGDVVKVRKEWRDKIERGDAYPIRETGAVCVEETSYQHSNTDQTVRIGNRWLWSYHFELAGGPW